ncbi:MAG: hypothetical protein HC904_07625 [Blastochloris sp.]|nr:hypothetical protein [Blastochloris sp.]
MNLVPTPPPAAPEALTQQRLFADTSESILTTRPQPTPFEGEANTLASSKTQGQGNPALPNQVGVEVRGMTLRDQEFSPELEGQPAPPAQQRKEPSEQAKQSDQTKEATSRELPQNIPLRSSGLVSVNNKPRTQPSAKTQEATAAQANTTDASTPPATFSAQKRATTIDGSAAVTNNSSLGVQESDMGRYKAKLYRAIGSRWYIYVREGSSQVSVGIVKIRFKVSSNGEISDLQIAEGSSHTALIAVSRRSILELRGQLDPFPPSMQEQLGDYYWEEVTFTIY